MFGFDFSKFAEMLPKVEAFAEQIKGIAQNMLNEQKKQRALLEKIAAKLEIDTENEGE